MTSTPEFMPVLVAGAHNDPAEGACIMEYISVLVGEPFGDTPMCTNLSLALAAQCINDNMPDRHRFEMLQFIERLVSTRTVISREQIVELQMWLVDQLKVDGKFPNAAFEVSHQRNAIRFAAGLKAIAEGEHSFTVDGETFSTIFFITERNTVDHISHALSALVTSIANDQGVTEGWQAGGLTPMQEDALQDEYAVRIVPFFHRFIDKFEEITGVSSGYTLTKEDLLRAFESPVECTLV